MITIPKLNDDEIITLAKVGNYFGNLEERIGEFTLNYNVMDTGEQTHEEYVELNNSEKYMLMVSRFPRGILQQPEYNVLFCVTSCSGEFNKNIAVKFQETTGIKLNPANEILERIVQERIDGIRFS